MRLHLVICVLALVTVLGPAAYADFPVSTNVNLDIQPQVAYNSTNQEYLVVWGEYVPFGGTFVPGRILGQRVAEDGTLLGSAFQIFPNGSYSRVAYNSALNEYLVITAPGTGILGQRVSNTGALIGGSIGLMTDQSYGRLLYNELSADYLLVAGQLVETPAGSGYWNLKIYSRRLSATGQPMGSPLFVDEIVDGYGGPEPAFAVAYAPIQSTETPNGRYLMVTGRGIMVTMLNSEGAPINVVYDPYHSGTTYRYVPFKTGSTVGGEFNVDVAYGAESGYSMTGQAFFVVWADQNNHWQSQEWSGIYGGFIDANKIAYATDEVIQDNAFPISAIADHWAYDNYVESWRPRVAYNAPAGKYMVTWRETPGTSSYNDTKVNHIRADKEFEAITMNPNDVLSATTGTENPEEPAIAASTISGKGLVAWIDYRNNASTRQDIYAAVYTIADVPPPPVTTTWVVTNTNDAGTGSLRQAILGANARTGMDTIAFDIPGSGVHTIQPLSELPTITDPVLIDGYTQPGSSPNAGAFYQGLNTVLTIELDGTNVPGGTGGFDGAGLRITGGNCTVRGLVINRVSGGGIVVGQQGGNVIEGNFIGTDPSGMTERHNSNGVVIEDASNNRIGGTTPGARNVISGNTHSGLLIVSDDNTAQGNLIGVAASGTVVVPNQYGLQVAQRNGNIIGGTEPSARNIISGNGATGLLLLGASETVVEGNVIGPQIDAASPLGNSGTGVLILGASNNTLGGAVSGAGNIIAFNGSEGVHINSGTDNRLNRNSIYANTALGVNLVGGVEDLRDATANDPGDGDTGPNNLQNYPVLTAVEGGEFLSALGSLNSTASTTFRLEFFATPSEDTASYREGQTFLGWTEVTTDGNGNADFSLTIGVPVGAGRWITATATDPNGNTSEFSAPLLIEYSSGDFTVTNTSNDGPGSLRQAILAANAIAGKNTITFSIPGNGPHVIHLQQILPEVTEPIVIDGYTQPGSSPNTNAFADGSNAVIMIELDGTGCGGCLAPGIYLSGGLSVVRGLAINNFGDGAGIWIRYKGGNRVEGCFLGTDASGTVARPNDYGVEILNAAYNWVGGVSPAQRNVISGNRFSGVVIGGGAGSDHNEVLGNYIGTTPSGNAILKGQRIGVDIYGSRNNTIGGLGESAGNLISGIGFEANGTPFPFYNRCGVFLEPGCSNNEVIANLIGTNAAGEIMLPNSMYGIVVQGDSNVIGSLEPGYGNIISGCVLGGVLVNKEDISQHIPLSNYVFGNRIGTDVSGTKPLGNRHGIIVQSASRVDIGKHDEISGSNTIAYNDSDGVRILESSNAVRVGINSIFANGMLGINLAGGTEDAHGCTENDAGDQDTGPNGLQNHPEITATMQNDTVTCQIALHASPDTYYDVRVYTTPASEPPHFGEGQTFLGGMGGTTDQSGYLHGSITLVVLPGAPLAVSATATDGNGNTSEFCHPYMAVTGINDHQNLSLPRETALLQNYPNPFNPKTVVSSQLSAVSDVRIAIFDVLGRQIATLVDERRAPGRYQDSFDASGLASGVYIYRMTAGGFVAVKTMLLVK